MGGNVFGNKTQPIKKENINDTLNAYFIQLSNLYPNKNNFFNLDSFKFLGSVGKKDVSGDIDLAIDAKNMISDFTDIELSKWNITKEDHTAKFLDLKKRARTATDNTLMYKAFLFLVAKNINESNSDIHCEEKKVSGGNMFSLFPQYENNIKQDYAVQIDWMVGDIEWLDFSYYSDVYSGNVKGLHRTQLMLSMFQHLNYSFNHVDGVKDKETGLIVAHNPQEALDILSKGFNTVITKDVASNYFKLIDVVNGLPIQDRISILKVYFKILDSTRADIPDDLQSDWLALKDEIGLTGKFLPEDSKLLSN